jgi:hypothetical protein
MSRPAGAECRKLAKILESKLGRTTANDTGGWCYPLNFSKKVRLDLAAIYSGDIEPDSGSSLRRNYR